jgi:hypothetical protein
MESLITDRESASLDGSAFGQEVAARTAEIMTAGSMSDDALHDAGLRAVAEVVARGEQLVAAGLDSDLAKAWLMSAADAFSAELDQAVRELKGRDARH